MIVISEKAQVFIREIILAHKDISHGNNFVIMYSQETILEYIDGSKKTFGPRLSIHFESEIEEDERLRIELADDLTIFVGPRAFFIRDKFMIDIDGENLVLRTQDHLY